jgi:hypothetical protein
VNAGAPARGRAFAGQELRPQAENDQVEAETPLRNVSLHDPVKNEAKGFPGESVGNEFHFRPIQVDAWIVETRAGRQIAGPDHDDLARSRAF